jgi:hypothetical protein
VNDCDPKETNVVCAPRGNPARDPLHPVREIPLLTRSGHLAWISSPWFEIGGTRFTLGRVAEISIRYTRIASSATRFRCRGSFRCRLCATPNGEDLLLLDDGKAGQADVCVARTRMSERGAIWDAAMSPPQGFVQAVPRSSVSPIA